MFGRNYAKKRCSGLSLLECVIVLLLSSILLLSSVLSYQFFIGKKQVTALVNQIVSALQYARLTAMTTQTIITFCPQGLQNTCGSQWQHGQLILDEKNQQVFRVLSPLPPHYQLIWKSTLGESDALRWRSNGFTFGQQGSFFICTPHAESAQIIILRTGRIRTEVGSISACDDSVK